MFPKVSGPPVARALGRTAAVALVALLVVSPASARADAADGGQPDAAVLGGGVEQPAPADGSDLDAAALESAARPIVLPTETTADIVAHWRAHQDDLDARDLKRAAGEIRDLEDLQDDLGLINLFSVSALLVRQGHALLAAGRFADALERCREAARLAPHLTAADLCVARASFQAHPLVLRPIFSALSQALSSTLHDVRNRRVAFAEQVLTLLFGLLVAGTALVLLLVLRNLRLALHDFRHLFPRRVRLQSGVIAAALVLVPWAFGFGLVGSLALLGLAVAFHFSRSETIAVAVAFTVVAASTLAMGGAVRAGAFGVHAQDVYLVERGEAPPGSVARLRMRAADGEAGYATWFALGHYDKRVADLKEAEGEYRQAVSRRRSAGALNDLGNVLFLEHREGEAADLYRAARQQDPSMPEAAYNLSTYYFRRGDLDQGNRAKQLAVALGGERIQSRLQTQEDFRSNRYLLDAPLPDRDLAQVADREGDHSLSLNGGAFTLIAGTTGGLPVPISALLAAVLVALAPLAGKRLRPSSRCEKCGRAVCARCDPDLGSSRGMCSQCISVFVRRTGVDAPDKIRKELEVRRFRRRQRLVVRTVGLFVSGAGHLLEGRIASGAVFLFLFSLLVSKVLFWNGVLRPPVALDHGSSPMRITGYGLVFVALYLFSLRHLLKHEETE